MARTPATDDEKAQYQEYLGNMKGVASIKPRTLIQWVTLYRKVRREHRISLARLAIINE